MGLFLYTQFYSNGLYVNFMPVHHCFDHCNFLLILKSEMRVLQLSSISNIVWLFAALAILYPIFHTKCDVICVFPIKALYMVEKTLLFLTCVFIIQRWWVFSHAFSPSIKIIVTDFSPLILFMYNIFLKKILSHPWNHGINLSLSWCIISFICCWNNLLECFLSVIFLWYLCLVLVSG